MSPEAGQAWFRLGMFLILSSLIILPFQPQGSAEFVVCTLSLVSGLSMLGIVALVVKLTSR
jgi:hypothetical protein